MVSSVGECYCQKMQIVQKEAVMIGGMVGQMHQEHRSSERSGIGVAETSMAGMIVVVVVVVEGKGCLQAERCQCWS